MGARAITEFDAASQLKPEKRDALIGRATARLNVGDLANALTDCDRVIHLGNGRSAKDLSLRGVIHWQSGHNDRALADLNDAVSLEPANNTPLTLRGMFMGETGGLQSAISDFSEVIRRNPRDSVVYCLRRAFSRLGNLAEASSDLDEATRTSPNLGLAYLERAYLECGRRQYGSALADLSLAVQLDPALQSAVVAQRALLRATCTDPVYRRAHEAIADARSLLEMKQGPDERDRESERLGSLLMALAQAGSGDYEFALKWVNRAIQLFEREHIRSGLVCSEHAAATLWLARLHGSIKDRRLAIEQLDNANLAIEVLRPRLQTLVKVY